MAALLMPVMLAAACGGGGGGSGGAVPPPVTPPPVAPPPTPSLAKTRVSPASPYAASCSGAPPTGTLYTDAEVEPQLAANPASPANLVGAWQQDRWSDGGSQALVVAASFDNGRSWATSAPPFSRCAGGRVALGTDYERASDPWVSIAPDGTVHLLGLVFTGATFAVGSSSAMVAARSTDGGRTWSAPAVLIADGANAFDDKGSITADATDATDARRVYAVWDRITPANDGPTYFARSVDGGASWQPARAIYDPGANRQTLGNVAVSLADGTLVVVFTQFDPDGNGGTNSTLRAIRSPDRGDTWGAPITIASQLAVGTQDPTTGVAVRDGSDVPSVAWDRANGVYVAWQDSRFSNGARDGIAFARSLDGGRTWSAPVRVNGAANVPAFTPTVHVRADGTIGIAYYDFRNDTADRAQLQTDYWLATSTDASTWSDTHVSGPFSLTDAPNANGLFLGDYQGLTSVGGEFIPWFVQAAPATSNRTDVYAAFGSQTVRAAQATARAAGAADAPHTAPDSAALDATGAPLSVDWRRRLAANAEAVRAQRRHRR